MVDRISSFLTILLIFVSVLCVITAIVSWLPGFLSGEYYFNRSIEGLFAQLGLTLEEYGNQVLKGIAEDTQSLKREYEQGLIDVNDQEFLRKKLFAHSKGHKASFVSFAFTAGYPFKEASYFGVTRSLLPGKENADDDASVSVQFAHIHNTTSLWYQELDKKNGTILSSVPVRVTPDYYLHERGWFVESMNGDLKNGIWGTIYLSSANDVKLGLYFSVPICNVSYTQSFSALECDDPNAKVGVIKTNLDLIILSNYFHSIPIPYWGFGILFEASGLYLATSDRDLNKRIPQNVRVPVESIEDKGIADVMRSIRALDGDYMDKSDFLKPFKFKYPVFLRMKGYVLAIFPMLGSSGQIDWTTVLFFNEFIINAFFYIYSLISMAFLCSVLVCGLGFTFGFGILIFIPLIRIQGAFKKIGEMDLNFKRMWSPIHEINRIYIHLERMRLWLNEYKSFFPQHLQEAIQEANKKRKKMQQNKKCCKIIPLSISSKKKKNKRHNRRIHDSKHLEGKPTSGDENEESNLNFKVNGKPQPDLSGKVHPDDGVSDQGKRLTKTNSFISVLSGTTVLSEELRKQSDDGTLVQAQMPMAMKVQGLLSNFKLGFNSQQVSCLLFKVRDFEDFIIDASKIVEYYTEISGVYSLLDHIATVSKGKIFSLASTHLIVWNVLVGKEDPHHLEKAFKCAIAAMEGMKRKKLDLQYNMVIDRGLALFGNIKVSPSRKTFDVVTPFRADMERMANIAGKELGLSGSVIFTENLQHRIKDFPLFNKDQSENNNAQNPDHNYLMRPICKYIYQSANDKYCNNASHIPLQPTILYECSYPSASIHPEKKEMENALLQKEGEEEGPEKREEEEEIREEFAKAFERFGMAFDLIHSAQGVIERVQEGKQILEEIQKTANGYFAKDGPFAKLLETANEIIKAHNDSQAISAGLPRKRSFR